MKTLFFIVVVTVGITTVGVSLFRHNSGRDPVPATDIENPGAPGMTNDGNIDGEPKEARRVEQEKTSRDNRAGVSVRPQPAAASGQAVAARAYETAVADAISKSASFGQKQAAWRQLLDTGKLDQAIADIEQKASDDPRAAEYPAALGQAYLQKAGSIKDLREQGILGMRADQSFDAALALDPENWDAKFWKAAAMSYWPAELGKGGEVVKQLLDLVEQQEHMPVKPEFAQVYALLGTQYEKQGYHDYAVQVWTRGVSLFPNDAQLRQKLLPPATKD